MKTFICFLFVLSIVACTNNDSRLRHYKVQSVAHYYLYHEMGMHVVELDSMYKIGDTVGIHVDGNTGEDQYVILERGR